MISENGVTKVKTGRAQPAGDKRPREQRSWTKLEQIEIAKANIRKRNIADILTLGVI